MYRQFCLFLATYSKTWNQLIDIGHIILACMIILGFTVDQNDIWLILYTKNIVNRRYFQLQNNIGRWVIFGEKLDIRRNAPCQFPVSFVSDEVLRSYKCIWYVSCNPFIYKHAGWSQTQKNGYILWQFPCLFLLYVDRNSKCTYVSKLGEIPKQEFNF